jgi:hypothetical protein
MVIPPSLAAEKSFDGVELLLKHFDPAKIRPLEIEPITSPAFRAELLESMRLHSQKAPGFVCPAEDLADDERQCIEGNNRLWCCIQLGVPFWAFDLGRHIDAAERIEMTFLYNRTRRVMTREELASKAAKYIEIKQCTDAEAARLLGVSAPTLSRAFGEKRIPAELKARTSVLGVSVRAIIAAAPPAVMGAVVTYAETADASGKLPTRDAVDAYIRHLKGNVGSCPRPARPIVLKHSGRTVTVTVGGADSPASLARDLTAIAAKLGKHAEVPMEGLPFLFK